MANGTRSRSIAMRWRPLQEKEKRRNKRRKKKEETNGEKKKSVFIYIRIILPYEKSCTYRVSYIFVRATVDGISRNNVGDVSSFN